MAAIGNCNVQAPDIAEQVSRLNGWQVGRTSLKLRNSDNAPDAWESSTLKTFEQLKVKGANPKTLEAHGVTQGPEGRQFRYMKAIPTGGLCLQCHGSELAPDVASKLDQLYPNDKARNYQRGDIRGAFTLTRDLD